MEEKNVVEQNAPTYEDLKKLCDKLYKDNQFLMQKLNNLTDVFNILPFYIDVVKHADNFDNVFVGKCMEQLYNIMIPQEEKKGE